MWKVGGIEIELVIGQVFLRADTEISEKREIFYSKACYSETKRDIGMGH